MSGVALSGSVPHGWAADPGSRVPWPGALALPFLTVYLVLLLWLPPQVGFQFLGSVGKPATLWGLACLAVWVLLRLSTGQSSRARDAAVKSAFLVFTVAVLISYALANSRGLPFDEASPADSAVVRIASWAGVLLLAHDGVASQLAFNTVIRRIVLVGGVFGALGLLQFVSGDLIIDRISLPLVTNDDVLASLTDRGGFTRASATSVHALEYAAVLAACLPLAISQGVVSRTSSALRRWWPAIAIGVAAVSSVSRSAVVGLVMGLVVLVPGLPRASRYAVLAGSAVTLSVLYVAVPGLIGTIKGLFLFAGEDSSTESRTNAVPIVTQIADNYAPFGRGLGTFLPKYYFTDNQYLMLLVEIGIIGLLAFAVCVLAAVVQAQRARIRAARAGREEVALHSHALTAAVAATATLFAFFDALSFAQAAGMLFLLLGLCGAAFNVSDQPDHGRARHAAASAEPSRTRGAAVTPETGFKGGALTND